MSDAQTLSDNPLISRYAGRDAAECWSPLRRARVWRRVWLALAEALHELGLTAADGVTPRVTAAQLEALRGHLDDVDLNRAAEHERRLRHDVMAHLPCVSVSHEAKAAFRDSTTSW